MLENLKYIYLAMYALDIYDSIHVLLCCASLLLMFWFFAWITFVFIQCNTDYELAERASWFWKHTKIWQGLSYILVVLSWCVLAIYPSENTVKAYIGVKATQAVGTYLEDSTDIPEKCKKTINTLWNKVDTYIESIDVSNTIDNATDSTAQKIKAIESKVGSDAVTDLITRVKQQTLDSIKKVEN